MGLSLNLMGQNAEPRNNSSYQGTYSYEVNRDFEREHLQQKNLDAFACRAKQKVKDFVDYVNLIANQDYDLELRKHAAEMTKKMFVNQQVVIKTHWFSGKHLKGYNLETFIKILEDLEGTKLSITVEDFKMIEALTPDKKEYKGILVAKQILSLENSGKLQKVSPYKDLEVEIILKQIPKKFGKQEQKIWELFLGNITVLENP